MKTLLIVIMAAFSVNALATNKNQSCDAYMQELWSNSPSPHVRLELGLKSLADAAELTLTPARQSNALARVKRFIAKYPKKRDDFEGMFYFVCTTDLSADEKDQIKDQFSQFEKL